MKAVKTKAQYKLDAKKKTKTKLTIIAVSFMLLCTALQSLNFLEVTPLVIKVLAICTGVITIYVLIDENILNFREVSNSKLDKEIQKNGYDNEVIQIINDIKKTRKLYFYDLKVIKSNSKVK